MAALQGNVSHGSNIPYTPSPDWSRGQIVSGSDWMQNASRRLGGTGMMTLATAGLGPATATVVVAGSGATGAQRVRIILETNGHRTTATGTALTAVTATQRVAVAGLGVGAIGETVQTSTENPVPGSAGMSSGGNAPAAAGRKKLVRFGSPDTAEKLAADAAKAEAILGHHGVSAMLRNPPGFPHGEAEFGEAAKAFQIVKTGKDRAHYTVVLPKPVTQEVADLFNSIFKFAGS